MVTYRSNPDMVARRIRGESILVPISNTMEALDSIISLNESAEFIRTRAAEGMSRDAITAALADAFDVTAETAAADVEAVLAELEAIGALKRVTQP